MSLSGPAKRLTIIIDEDHTWHHKPLCPEIIKRAHAAGLAGASAFRGIEGFGASSRVHTSRILSLLGTLVGAPARYLTDRAVQSRHESAFPWGTLIVNVVASFVLGALVGAASRVDPEIAALVGTGFCGALSTYSTFSYETIRLTGEGARLYAVANVALSLVAGIGAAALGVSVGMLVR